jgi:tRNA pseudouridine55 synthase
MLQFVSIYKAKNQSSYSALAKLKKFFNTSKIGHLGTLDPLAEGVLGVAIGEATKLIPLVNTEPKEYIVEIFFGHQTPTFDAENVDFAKLPKLSTADFDFSLKDITDYLDANVGWILQKPPIFSAVWVNGKRAYDLARKNKIEEGDLEPRKVFLAEYEVLDFSLPIIKLRIKTGSGFYVRSLVRDLALNFRTTAFMYSLVRTQVGAFNIQNQSIFDLDDREKSVIPQLNPEELYLEYQAVELMQEDYDRLKKGLLIYAKNPILNKYIFGYFSGKLCSILYQVTDPETQKDYWKVYKNLNHDELN